MHVALTHPGVGNAHEFRLGTHFIHGGTACVTHGCTQTANQLMDDVTHGAFAGHATFNTFRHQFFNAFAGILEIAVAGALAHGTNGTHATISLVTPALEQFDFA